MREGPGEQTETGVHKDNVIYDVVNSFCKIDEVTLFPSDLGHVTVKGGVAIQATAQHTQVSCVKVKRRASFVSASHAHCCSHNRPRSSAMATAEARESTFNLV